MDTALPPDVCVRPPAGCREWRPPTQSGHRILRHLDDSFRGTTVIPSFESVDSLSAKPALRTTALLNLRESAPEKVERHYRRPQAVCKHHFTSVRSVS